MKKFNTSPISGMQELLPNLQLEFNRLKAGISDTLMAHGFQNIETPTIDRVEVLLAKAGGDTEKQIYKVVKTAETANDADQALRFDHTVPLARYMVEHMNELTFPAKLSQIGRNFRGERAQKGRFREFYQCDADIVGWNNLPVAYDAEVIMTMMDALTVLPLPGFVVRVSNRKLLSGLLEELNLQHQAQEIYNIVDHAEKVPPEKTVSNLEELGLGGENVVKITTFMQVHGCLDTVVEQLQKLGIQNATFLEGIDELGQVLAVLEKKVLRMNNAGDSNFPRYRVEADMLIVRGLDYYTGTVFETVVPAYREIGSICSGGRYDNLASHYTDQKLPGVGGSIGLTRLFYILRNYGLIELQNVKPVEFCLIPISLNERNAAEKLAERLRQLGHTVDVVLTEKKLGDKLSYAGKIAQKAVIIGEDEVKSQQYVYKDLQTGEMVDLFLGEPSV